MATIIEESTTCDGYDVVTDLNNSHGERHIWHFLSQPDDTQAAVDALEVDYIDNLLSAWVVEAENGTIIQ
jgi:hypothetical protein